ncbi:MAG: DUF3253 domain-containing protein [Mycobacteriaceae bacterium]
MFQLQVAIRRLLDGRAGSICPSEAARAVGGENWRDLMEPAREAARAMARDGEVEITQRGVVLDPDAVWRGPIRVRLPKSSQPAGSVPDAAGGR